MDFTEIKKDLNMRSFPKGGTPLLFYPRGLRCLPFFYTLIKLSGLIYFIYIAIIIHLHFLHRKVMYDNYCTRIIMINQTEKFLYSTSVIHFDLSICLLFLFENDEVIFV